MTEDPGRIAFSIERVSKNPTVAAGFTGFLLLATGGALLESNKHVSPILMYCFLGLGGAVLVLFAALVLWQTFWRRGNTSILKNMGDVRKELKAAFRNTKAGAIYQTFVGTNLIAANQDLIHLIPSAKDRKSQSPDIHIYRYFFVTSAFDINFVKHSIAFVREAEKDKGVVLNNYIWSNVYTPRSAKPPSKETPSEKAPSENVLAAVFPNITCFPDRLIVTMSNRDDQRDGNPIIVKDGDSKDAVGLLVRSVKVAESISSLYFERLSNNRTMDISTIVAKLHETDREMFLSAAVNAMAKEWRTHEHFAVAGKNGERIEAAALVGSFARRLRRRKESAPLGANAERIGRYPGEEVDVVVFVRDVVQKDIQVLKEIGRRVLQRFTIQGVEQFVIDTDMSPVGQYEAGRASGQTVVHMLVNNADTKAMRNIQPSRLVASHRVQNAVMLIGTQREFHQLYGEPGEPEANDLLSSPLGIGDLLDQLRERRVKVRYWHDGQMVESSQTMEPSQYDAFATYVLKWTSVNFRRVLELYADPEQWRLYWHQHSEVLGLKEDESPEGARLFAEKIRELLQAGKQELKRHRAKLDRLEQSDQRTGGPAAD